MAKHLLFFQLYRWGKTVELIEQDRKLGYMNLRNSEQGDSMNRVFWFSNTF